MNVEQLKIITGKYFINNKDMKKFTIVLLVIFIVLQSFIFFPLNSFIAKLKGLYLLEIAIYILVFALPIYFLQMFCARYQINKIWFFIGFYTISNLVALSINFLIINYLFKSGSSIDLDTYSMFNIIIYLIVFTILQIGSSVLYKVLINYE